MCVRLGLDGRLNATAHRPFYLLVLVHQDRKGNLRSLVLLRYILASVVVVDDLAILLECQFTDSALVDAVLAALVLDLCPVVNHRLAFLGRCRNRAFVPHSVYLVLS